MDNIFKVVTKQNRMKYMNLMNFDQFLQALDVLAERMESREASHSKKFKILVQSLAKHITEWTVAYNRYQPFKKEFYWLTLISVLSLLIPLTDVMVKV
jgi:hypothetical protein